MRNKVSLIRWQMNLMRLLVWQSGNVSKHRSFTLRLSLNCSARILSSMICRLNTPSWLRRVKIKLLNLSNNNRWLWSYRHKFRICKLRAKDSSKRLLRPKKNARKLTTRELKQPLPWSNLTKQESSWTSWWDLKGHFQCQSVTSSSDSSKIILVITQSMTAVANSTPTLRCQTRPNSSRCNSLTAVVGSSSRERCQEPMLVARKRMHSGTRHLRTIRDSGSES